MREFIDAGESTRSADRDGLQEMLAFIAATRVQFRLVHKLDRLARNRADDVMIHLALKEAGVILVSPTENIDETPSGMLVHGIMSTIHRMLTNPYYKGQVSFKGASYDGLHQPLVAMEVWYRVQAVLSAHQVSGERTQAHDHYHKGTVYCGQCGSRLTLTNARSRQNMIYPYFICAGRHSKRTNCERKAMYVPDIEAAVEDYYRNVQIPEHIVTALRELITAEFDRLHAIAKQERHAYTAERDTLRDERGKLLQAHYAGVVPLDLLATEQDRIARHLAFLDAQINAGDIEYEQAKAHLEDCLALAGDCHAIYMSIDDSLRRLANQAFFDKLTVTDADTIDGQPGEPFNILFDPDVQRIAVERQHQTKESGRQTGNVVGLNNDQLVEAIGHYGNRRQRVERLVSAWNHGSDGVAEPAGEPEDPLIAALAEPRRRARTQLTEEEVDAMRTARTSNVSVTALAERFGVHRGTIWAKTRQRLHTTTSRLL